MILSVVNLGHGIEEMLPEMEEHIYTFKRKVNLLERLVIYNSKPHCPELLTAVVQDGQPYELYHVVSISSHDQFNSTVREGF